MKGVGTAKEFLNYYHERVVALDCNGGDRGDGDGNGNRGVAEKENEQQDQ